MAEENKLDISAISFDDMLGDGLETMPAEPETVEKIDSEVDEEVEDIVDESKTEEYEEESETEEYEETENDDAEEDSAGQGVIFEIANTLGLELNDEYDDTVEGLTNFVRDMSQEAAEEQLSQLFEQYPEVQRHLDYVMSGGNSEEFMQAHNPQVDFSAVEIDQEDVNTQRIILANYFQAKGHDNEFIEDMLESLESRGSLFSKSEVARQELATAQEQYRQELFEKQQAEFQRQQEETEEFWEGVANRIETGNEFAGVRIPDNQKAKFFDYISEPVGPNGETQRDLDYSQSELEVKLAMDYLMYNGFKLDDIINTRARTKSVQSLRERIVSNEQQVKNARRTQRRQRQFDTDDLDLNALF